MDYEEFNKEYKEFSDWWNNSEEFSKKTDELIWGKDAAMNRAAKKFTQLEGKGLAYPSEEFLNSKAGEEALTDAWMNYGQSPRQDEWTGQEDETPRLLPKPIMGLVKNTITSTNFTPDDRVNSPSHYTSGRMESIDIIEDAIAVAPTPKEGFLQGQVLKYILRVWLKDNPLEDLKKARWYLDRLIKSLE